MSIVRKETWYWFIRVARHGLNEGVWIHGNVRESISDKVIKREGRQIRGWKRQGRVLYYNTIYWDC